MDLNQNEENERGLTWSRERVWESRIFHPLQLPQPPDEDNPEDEAGFAVDDYVILSYEGELFPGQITAISEEEKMCEIRAMVKSGFNKVPDPNKARFLIGPIAQILSHGSHKTNF